MRRYSYGIACIANALRQGWQLERQHPQRNPA
nr:MAG TPA: hypothetical protein [Caudoviricetes sp.]DAT87363.1 MAG TPA: hypothetical protein [Caudoviricetes sp.]